MSILYAVHTHYFAEEAKLDMFCFHLRIRMRMTFSCVQGEGPEYLNDALFPIRCIGAYAEQISASRWHGYVLCIMDHSSVPTVEQCSI